MEEISNSQIQQIQDEAQGHESEDTNQFLTFSVNDNEYGVDIMAL